MNAVVIPDVELDDPTRFISRVAKLIPAYQIYAAPGRFWCSYEGNKSILAKLTEHQTRPTAGFMLTRAIPVP
jgi:hypothetical protein